MVVVTSRFRVANAMEQAVATAFLQRPGYVDHAPGFLGLEVFTDAADPTVFYLVTRWIDFALYDAWHSSPEHRRSHAFMPKGLRLDPAYTRIVQLERLEPAGGPPLDALIRDHAPVLARALAQSKAWHFLTTAADGTITAVNRAFGLRLKTPEAELLGTPLWDYLTEADGTALRAALAHGERTLGESRLLNFVDAARIPISIRCHVDVQPDGFIIVGEEPAAENQAAQAEMLRLTNELAVANRENQRNSRELLKMKQELERTLEELQSSYWHLRKIQEHLPVCSMCKKIKTGHADSDWTDLLAYMTDHARVLTHGLCPECFEKQMAELDEDRPKDTQ